MTGNKLAAAKLGLKVNAAQFSLLVAVNALVGGVVGQQQTVLPLLAADDFGLTGYTVIFIYIVAFGTTKAASNYAAGILVDRFGRKPVLLTGWLLVKKTHGHAALEQRHQTNQATPLPTAATPSSWNVFALRAPLRPPPRRLGCRPTGDRRPVRPLRT